MTPDKFSKKTDTGLSGPQDLLGGSLDQKAGSNSRLSIEVLRGHEIQKLNIALPKSSSFFFFQSSILFKKKKSFFRILPNNWLKLSRKNGRWKPGVGGDADVYTTAFCGLVLLANNDPTHLPSIKKAMVVKKSSVASIDINDPKKVPKIGRLLPMGFSF